MNKRTEEKGDLISRSALRKQFKKSLLITEVALYEARKLIDDAPTVDKGYQEGHIDGVLQAEKLYARPIGKWIPQTAYDGFTYWKCSECGHHNDFAITKFCFECGADMRGRKE